MGQDWANLHRYRAANLAAIALAPNQLAELKGPCGDNNRAGDKRKPRSGADAHRDDRSARQRAFSLVRALLSPFQIFLKQLIALRRRA